jgi:hypothetical protein
MNYVQFAEQYENQQELLIKGLMYMEIMEFADKINAYDPKVIDMYIKEGYDLYLNSDHISPIEIGMSIWWVFNDFTQWDGNPEEDHINLYDVEDNIVEYIDKFRTW